MVPFATTFRTKKSLSQNFLHDEQVLVAIVTACNITEDDYVLEIGAGQGALSQHLVTLCACLTLLELDDRLIEPLRQRFSQASVRVLHENALQFDYDAVAAKPIKIIGNLPYHLSSALVQQFVRQHEAIKDIHVMVQREVAERLCCGVAAGKQRGWLSVFVQARFGAEILFEVAPHCFSPAPKVISCFVRLQPHERYLYLYDNAIIGQWKNFLLTAFGSKRKNLRNNFKSFFVAVDWQEIGIDATLRAEQLTIEQLAILFGYWQQQSHSSPQA